MSGSETPRKTQTHSGEGTAKEEQRDAEDAHLADGGGAAPTQCWQHQRLEEERRDSPLEPPGKPGPADTVMSAQ